MGSCTEKETQTDRIKHMKDNGKVSKERQEKLKTFTTYVTMAGQGGGTSPPLTTHILDTARGQPANGVAMTLSKLDQSGQWQTMETGITNTDGRGGFFGSSDQWTAGTYKLYFDTGSYFASLHTKGFYPYVEVAFHVEDPGQHYHVPLLLSPYSYSTYRGS
ncbi:5-hydroxyisourate hydrolase-like isoform X1 [Mizuhopecten yessoensis]|uniref:5-hydroxyisourate hydrolase-like isoform X1 n=1 Tax=Mizuhopecten yessoensis TaxID=6573 RepID=UPI000B45989F|nr:5-hydroxyisourate hydrolase-like isoform X1 [Mizuhopecten yessoensis]